MKNMKTIKKAKLKTKATPLYARIINGKVVTGYNKSLLADMVFTARLSSKLNNK